MVRQKSRLLCVLPLVTTALPGSEATGTEAITALGIDAAELTVPTATGVDVEKRLGRYRAFVLLDAVQNGAGGGFFNERLAEVASGVTGVSAGWTWRIRASWKRGDDDRGQPVSSTRLRLQELSRSLDLGEGWTVCAGKRALGWDPSWFSSPLGFFDGPRDPADVVDVREVAEGRPLVVLTKSGGTRAFTLAYSDDRDERPGRSGRLRQAAASLSGSLGEGTYTLVAQKELGHPVGAGLAATMPVKMQGVLYASAFMRRENSRSFAHTAAGLTWVLGEASTLMAEWGRNDFPLEAGLLGSRYRREDLFVRASHAVGDRSIAVMLHADRVHRGRGLHVMVDQRFSARLAGGLSATWLLEEPMGLPRALPRAAAKAWIKYAFDVPIHYRWSSR